MKTATIMSLVALTGGGIALQATASQGTTIVSDLSVYETPSGTFIAKLADGNILAVDLGDGGTIVSKIGYGVLGKDSDVYFTELVIATIIEAKSIEAPQTGDLMLAKTGDVLETSLYELTAAFVGEVDESEDQTFMLGENGLVLSASADEHLMTARLSSLSLLGVEMNRMEINGTVLIARMTDSAGATTSDIMVFQADGVLVSPDTQLLASLFTASSATATGTQVMDGAIAAADDVPTGERVAVAA